MRDIKFRQLVNGRFHYWGFMGPGHFIGPLNPTDPSQQYTGLHDNNGVEIYEGDILYEGDGYLFEVVWDTHWAAFKLQWRTKAIQYPGWNRGQKMSIIGNIHEHPELLK